MFGQGFAKPLKLYEKKPDDNGRQQQQPQRCFMDLLREHIAEATSDGFDDSCSKYKGKSQFSVPSVRAWFEMFDTIHDLFINEPDAKTLAATDADAPSSRQHFKRQLHRHLATAFDTDMRFFRECGEHGIDVAVEIYRDMLPTHYSFEFHQRKVD